jgi:hypothetical protein
MTQERPAEAVDSRALNLATQQRERETALLTLARLREEAGAEIARLIDFLDASDDYVMTEREPSINGDDREAEDEHDEPSLGWTDREASRGRYSGIDDREHEHDGREPDDEAGFAAVVSL